jgi:hypothetical protein
MTPINPFPDSSFTFNFRSEILYSVTASLTKSKIKGLKGIGQYDGGISTNFEFSDIEG